MTDYIALRADITPCSETATDLLAAFLADAGYETFLPDDTGLTAYIPSHAYDPHAARQAADSLPGAPQVRLTSEIVKGRDWNEEWEKNYFKPIVIADRCVVCSSFHTDVPEVEHRIVIDPRMAFGTGHHATTALIMRILLDTDLNGAKIIDMGTGTGILSILALQLGASAATGIEIDPDAADNARDNVALNRSEARIITGDASALESLEQADIFIANINRNIILADIDLYKARIRPGGLLILSGFYRADVSLIEAAAEMSEDAVYTDGDWTALVLRNE